MYRADLDLAGRSLPMVTIRVEKRYGSATVHSCVTAPSIEQALALAGEGARVVTPIDGEPFFAPPRRTFGRPSTRVAKPRTRGVQATGK